MLTDRSLLAFSPVLLTTSEMRRLVMELRTPQFVAAHPVLQAAYAHHAFVTVHPFADGNGRVARALASRFTSRSASIPLLVYADQKPAYLAALREADEGRFSAFVGLVLEATVDLMNELTLRLRAARAPSVRESVADVEWLYVQAGGLTHAELDTVAMRIARALRDEIARQLPEGSPGRVESIVQQEGSTITPRSASHRPVVGKKSAVTVRLRSAPPAKASVEDRMYVVVARHPATRATFRIEPTDGRDPLDVRFNQVHPAESDAFRSLLTSWVRIRLSELGATLQNRAAEALRSRGL